MSLAGFQFPTNSNRASRNKLVDEFYGPEASSTLIIFGLQIGFQSPQTYLFSQGLLRDAVLSFINMMDLEHLTGLIGGSPSFVYRYIHYEFIQTTWSVCIYQYVTTLTTQ